MSFIITAAAMLLACLAFVAIPLVKMRRNNARDAASLSDALYQSRLQELEADVRDGVLEGSDFDAAKGDLDAEFVAARRVSGKTLGTKRGRQAAIVVAVLLPIVAAVMYLSLGSWQSALYGDDSPTAVIANVQQRLSENPDDASGWAFLGRVYFANKQYVSAAKAYQHAVKLTGGKNAELLSALGAAQLLGNKMRASSEQTALFDKALKLDPTDPGALLFGGIAAMQEGNKAVAITRWQRLLKQNPPAQLRKVLAARIVAAGGVLPQIRQQAADASSASTITVRVTLAPQLNAAVPEHSTLFVFARPADKRQGPPLAVKRLQVSAFPINIKLSDADAMIPGRSLEDYKRLRVVARISQTGTTRKRRGDMFGTTTFDWKEASKPLLLTIDTVADKTP